MRKKADIPFSGDAFFHARTFPTILGVLLPASTSARIRVVEGGRKKGETIAQEDVLVHKSL